MRHPNHHESQFPRIVFIRSNITQNKKHVADETIKPYFVTSQVLQRKVAPHAHIVGVFFYSCHSHWTLSCEVAVSSPTCFRISSSDTYLLSTLSSANFFSTKSDAHVCVNPKRPTVQMPTLGQIEFSALTQPILPILPDEGHANFYGA